MTPELMEAGTRRLQAMERRSEGSSGGRAASYGRVVR